MMKREYQRQIVILMICRAVLLSALLAAGLLIGRALGQPLVGSRHFYLLTAAGYGLTVLYALLHPIWSRHIAAAIIQLVGDVLLVTGYVCVTGGIDSPFSLLYFLPLIAASVMIGRRGALASAAGAWAAYALVVVLIVHGYLPGPASSESATSSQGLAEAVALNKRAAFALLSHFVGFFTVAWLSSRLAMKLQAAGDELAEQREALARVQALNKNIIDSITSGIVTADMEGRITFMNRGAEEITGRRLAAVEGMRVAAFLQRDEEFMQEVRDILAHEKRHRFDNPMLRPDGAAIFLGFTSAVLREQRGEPMGFIFSFQDLTDIKALEEEVRLKDRMAALGEMAAGIAHEIRNPLASMSGSVQILAKTLETTGDEAELLDIMLRESRRLDRIIGDFLLFARPGRFRPGTADLVPVLRESLTLLRNSEELGAACSIETAFEDVPVMASVDVNRIRQVFWNLARNALKAMPDGGVLRVRAFNDSDGKVAISFADQGVGMEEADIARAFQPFHGSFREGTGLGLSVVFRIVQEHGGRIQIKSHVGEGTEVVVSLPAASTGAAITDAAGSLSREGFAASGSRS